jgi:hypothetical protein
MSAEDEVYPMTLLTEELKSDEVETRIKAMRRLRTVAQALGPERTRSDLLPFLRGTPNISLRSCYEPGYLPLYIKSTPEQMPRRTRTKCSWRWPKSSEASWTSWAAPSTRTC